MSIFLCFLLYAGHCSVINIKTIQCPTLEFVKLGCVRAPARDISPFVSLVPQAVKGHCYILRCDSLSRKTVSDLAGIRSCVSLYIP